VIPAAWDSVTAAAFVDGLDDTARRLLFDALRDSERAAQLTALISVVSAQLAGLEYRLPGGGQEPEITGVIFYPVKFGNGYYLGAAGQVYLSSGTSISVDFAAEISEAFTELYGCVGADSGFAYCPASRAHRFDDCGAGFNLGEWISSEYGSGTRHHQAVLTG
jgi:hypothetical protein